MGWNYENANTKFLLPFRTFKEGREMIWFLFLIIWRQIIPTETFYCMFQPGAGFFYIRHINPWNRIYNRNTDIALSEVVKSYDWAICNISKSSSLPPSSAPILTGTAEKKQYLGNNNKKLCFGQKSPGLCSVLIKSPDIGCPRVAGHTAQRGIGVMLGLRDDPVCFFSGPLLEMGTVPESF